MPPAARVGDETSHGDFLGPGPGSSNVLIGGKPAWRGKIDSHICPLSSGPVPHVGGVVSLGSTTVFINNFPATRQGDNVIEVGPPATEVGPPATEVGSPIKTILPNTISIGLSTVLIG